MIILYIVSLAAIGALSQISDCEYGYFTSNGDTCVFDCEYSSNYVSISSLSFDFIKEQCPNVQSAYENGGCDSLDDLVYGDAYCDCPYCKCSSIGSELIETFGNNPSKECYNCTCSSAPSWSGITDNIYQCDELSSVYNPWEWDLYSCPPNECIVPHERWGYNITYYAGDNWWSNDVDYFELCTKFCYCPGSGDPVCQTGYENILGIYPTLKTQFMSECGNNLRACYNMDTQSYDTDKLFSTNTRSSCGYNCPSCSCPDGKVENDTWYHEWQDLYDINTNSVQCSLCTCKRDYYDDYLYADCEWSDAYAVGIRSCPLTSSETFTCHEESSNSSDPSTLNPITCSASDDGIALTTNYCEWNDYDVWDIFDEGEYQWGCGDSLFCEAFASDGCIYSNTSITWTDCDGVVQTQNLNGYLGCCDASLKDNCNYYETILLDECTQSTAYETFLESVYRCDYFNPECDEEVDEITCDGVQQLYRSRYECWCTAYSIIYPLLSTESQAILQAAMDDNFATGTDIGVWNEEIGCDIQFVCDLSSGKINAGTTVSPTTSEPTPSPVTLIENGCTPECQDGYVSIAIGAMIIINFI